MLDLDATDDPLHGHQEGRFFHGYYDCHCYLPLYIFCGRQLLAAKLRRSNIDASAGAIEEVARIISQIRARWPRVRIILRGDGGFARKPARADARTLYEQIYCARGEMENRIKECRFDLFADRTSAATMRANQLRLGFASMAHMPVTALRRIGLAGTELAAANLWHNPPEAPEDRRPGHSQRPPHPPRHGVELPRRRRFPPRPRSFMRLIRDRPAHPTAPPTNPTFDRAGAQCQAVPDRPSGPRTPA